MTSPFPGMDPYLEGYLWPDVHQALATKVRQQLAPQVRPRYVARLAVYVMEDPSPEAEVGILVPDVQVLETASSDASPHESVGRSQPTPAALLIPAMAPLEVKVVRVEIRDAAQDRLVTCIEILSPVNKREPGLTSYRRKRHKLVQAGVHLLELDLLRRGTRPVAHPRIPACRYLVLLTRAEASTTEVWPLALEDRLPALPVPLSAPDPEVVLELQPALAAVYEEAAYELSIDYDSDPPPPELTDAQLQWMRGLKRPR